MTFSGPRHRILAPLALAGTALTVAGCTSSGSTPPAPTSSIHAPSSTAPTLSVTTAGPASTAHSEAPVPAENNPPGDIPDNLAFVPFRYPAGGVSFTHPEGWAQNSTASSVVFTDKLNGMEVFAAKPDATPTVAAARTSDVPALRAAQPAFELQSVSAVSEPAGSGVRIVYRRNSAADPVTGRKYRDEVQRYELLVAGKVVVIELYGPVGADNVDAYRTMITGLKAA